MESDQADLDVIMVGPWMLCGIGWSLIWTLDVMMVGPWMLCEFGWGLISLIWTLLGSNGV